MTLHVIFFSVFVLDTGFHVFIWVGKDASSHEKGGGLMLAHVSIAIILHVYHRCRSGGGGITPNGLTHPASYSRTLGVVQTLSK